MSRASKLISLSAIAFAVMSCGGSEQAAQMAKVDGVIEGAPASEVVIGKLDVNQLVVLDTLTTDQDGKFQYELEVKKGNPEFVYVYYEGAKVASLLLEADDEVAVNVPVEGETLIEGSEESAKLMQVELEHAAMSALFADYAAQLEDASQSQYDKVVRQMTENYREYNKKSIKYVMQNCHSLTAIPVLYRTLGDLPLFAMSTDAVMFSSIADSLATVYPESKFVKSLRADADARMAELELMRRIELAEEVGYLDIALPGLDGSVKKLSEVDSKVVLLYFWTSSRANQNNFNIEVLKKLYNDYHKKGFDIYQVSLDVDKVQWATTVMGQNLPWTNVCDIRGAASEYATLYNLQALPAAFVISDGELVDGELVDEASFRKLLDKLLK
jgi:peroxiredoxin